jgi:hypothetical protein
VHEIISLLDSIANVANIITTEKNILLNNFYSLLKKVGDFEVYNNLFVSDINLDKLTETFETNIPVDVIKIVVDYCQLSIYNSQDCHVILDKIIPLKDLPVPPPAPIIPWETSEKVEKSKKINVGCSFFSLISSLFKKSEQKIKTQYFLKK